MNILRMLEELRREQQQIDEAILVIERLAAGTGGKRRGRPPNWMSAMKTADGSIDPTAAGMRRSFSVATRKRMAAAQKRRWAAAKAKAKAAAA